MPKQISAYISNETQAKMGKYTNAYEVKKDFLIEQELYQTRSHRSR